MSPLLNPRIVSWLERCALMLLALYLGLHAMPQAWGTLNTDFPNYYTSARLAHEGYDTSRAYEWVWIQREKDHRAIDDRLIGLIPFTPFSTLVMWPITGLQPLAAKHCWLLLNLALLVPLVWMLRSMTGLSYQRIALVIAVSVPLQVNLLYGQFYFFLLVMLVAACWAYLRNWHVLAGALVALAAATKIFPVLFLIFFLQRRNWRALAAGVVTGLAAAAVSVATLGWNMHRTFLHEILPWALHGEGMSPYVTSAASMSTILHYLFLAEPQWNPHPWHSSLLCYALLEPTLQTLVLAPAILLIRKDDRTPGRILLEWSALLTASLATSTMPASYHFVLMMLPVCVLAAELLRRKWYGWLGVLAIVYLGIGFSVPSPSKQMGPAILLYTPRLPLVLALLLGFYLLLGRDRGEGRPRWDWTQYAWAAAMAVSVVLGVRSTLQQQRAVREEYAFRLPLTTPAYLEGDARQTGARIGYVGFLPDGYHLVEAGDDAVRIDPSADDDLSFAGGSGHVWVERALSPHSEVVDVRTALRVVVDDAREPMLSADGQSLAFVRDDHGRGRLMVRNGFQSDAATEAALTPPSLNIYEASFVSEKDYAFSAVEDGRPPQIYLTDGAHTNTSLALGESRYPALSPDGRWLAYSHLEHGMWNLWVRDQGTGATRRIGDVPCNQIQPAWEDDSKTLLYSTDCGRSLWLTAIARRRVIP